MVDVPLAQRTEVGPRRAGDVKQPFALADDPLIDFGRDLSKFSGVVFDKLVRTKAANEEAAYHGVVNTSMQEWDAFVAGHPGAGYDQLQAQRDKMMLKIKNAGAEATTGIAKRNNSNWFKANETLIHAKTQTSMEAIRARQGLNAYQLHQKNNMANFNYEGYSSNMESMIDAGMLDRDVAEARQEFDFDVMQKAQRKLAIDAAAKVGMEAWQNTVTPENPEGDLNAAFDAVAALNIPEGDKQEIESEIKTRVTNRRAENTLQLEKSQEDARQAIVDRFVQIDPNTGVPNLDDIDGFINNTSLPPAEKELWMNKAKSRAESIIKGTGDKFTQHDSDVYSRLLIDLTTDPKSHTVSEISQFVGLGEDGGISTDQFSELSAIIKKETTKPDDPNYENFIRVLNDMKVNDIFDPKDESENSIQWFNTVSQFNSWYDDFVNRTKKPPTFNDMQDWYKLKTADFVTKRLIDFGNVVDIAGGVAAGQPSAIFKAIIGAAGGSREAVEAKAKRLEPFSPAETRSILQSIEAGKNTAGILDKIEKERGNKGLIRVISPSGQTGTVPADQLQQALDKGFKRQ